MELQQDRSDGVLVLAPIGRVDSNSSGELETQLMALLGAGERRLVVDMRGVEYISSAGLRVLLLLARRLQETAGEVVLCSMGKAVRQVFELAGFLSIFKVEPSREHALARLAKPR